MKKFRGLLLNAEQLDEYKQISRAAGEPIRVALIDDGVDGVDLGYPLWGGRTFCPRDEENRLSHPYYASAMGHGTAMAKLITFMCPRTQLYVLRLDLLETDSSKGARGVSARSAAQVLLTLPYALAPPPFPLLPLFTFSLFRLSPSPFLLLLLQPAKLPP